MGVFSFPNSKKAGDVRDAFSEDDLPAANRAEAFRMESAVLRTLLAKHDRREEPGQDPMEGEFPGWWVAS